MLWQNQGEEEPGGLDGAGRRPGRCRASAKALESPPVPYRDSGSVSCGNVGRDWTEVRTRMRSVVEAGRGGAEVRTRMRSVVEAGRGGGAEPPVTRLVILFVLNVISVFEDFLRSFK
jgi:hypothetical protein